MKQILIGKDVDYGLKKGETSGAGAKAVDSPHDLAAGAFGIYKIASTGRGLTLLTSANIATEGVDLKSVQVAVGLFDGCIVSDTIQMGRIFDFRAANFQADRPMVITIGATGDAGSGLRIPTAQADRKVGDEYLVKVINSTGGYAPYAPKRTYSYVSQKDAETDAEILTGLAAAINDGTDFTVVTAAASATALTLTVKKAETLIDVALDGQLFRASRKVTTERNFGTGSSDSIKALEYEYAGWDGVTDRINAIAITPASNVVDGTNYDSYFINHHYEHKAHDGINGTNTRQKQLVLAVPNGATTSATTALEAVVAALIGVKPESGTDTAAGA